MSYIVLARKWRPQNFDDVIGQDNVITTLKNAIKANRLAHAYIFAGPRGVGKTSTARILAKSLNCQNGPAISPCNKCSPCIEITEARSLDVIEIDGASNRGIEEIRTLRENVRFSPAQGRYKVYIIDEVHMLTTEAFNALLKTLEEPPPHVKFIFATTHPQKILPTIVSRCQFLEFRRVPNLTIIKKLKDIAQHEHISVSDDVLLAIAKASDGSVRDAESVLDELVSFTNGNIQLEDVNSVLGVVEQEFLFEITDRMISKDASSVLQLLDKLVDQGKDPGQLLINLIEHFRNLMIVKVTTRDHEKLIDLPKETCDRIAKQSLEISLDDIFLGFNVLLGAQEMARRIDSLRIPLEVALVKLCTKGKPLVESKTVNHQDKIKTLPKEKNNPNKAENLKISNDDCVLQPNEGPQQKELNSSPPEDSLEIESEEESTINNQPQLDLENINNLWLHFIDRLTKVKVSAAHYLELGRPIKASGAVLTIGFSKSSSFQKEALERKENRLILEDIWKGILGHSIKIDFAFTNEKDEPKPISSEIDPEVKSVLDAFNGRIVRKSM